jgi:hypothetical protein
MTTLRTLLVIALLGGCTSAPPAAAPTCADAPYQDPGPWASGVTTLDVGGVPVEVWYPVDRDAVSGMPRDVYDMRDFLPEEMRTEIPVDAPTTFETPAYRDAPLASGDEAFPVVYFSHGLGGFRTQSTAITAHVAEWGHFVVAPQHPERDLAQVLGGGMIADAAYTQISNAHARMIELDATGGRFAGRVDLEHLAVMGHSAGGGAVQGLVDDSEIGFDTWIGMATVTGPRVSTIPGLLLGGTADGLATPDSMMNLFMNDITATSARFVEIENAGHLAFSDLCVIGRERGGVLQIAMDAGLPIEPVVIQLANDGCTEDYLPVEEAWPAIRHYLVAHLRDTLGAADGGATGDGLEDASTACFDGKIERFVRR